MGRDSDPKLLPMLDEILGCLRCPACRGPLSHQATRLSCEACGRVFPIVNGVVRCAGSTNYTDSFGFQWGKYARTQLDDATSHESERDFRQRTGFTPEQLSQKLVLDIGCGMGRFAEVASRWGARVVGVDLSPAAEVAARNLAGRQNVLFFQADAMALPFAAETFDIIYSIGVLHHTPNCEEAFKRAPSLLKPGGYIAIWLYHGYNRWYRFSDLYRKVTSRLPVRLLHVLCHVAIPLYYVHQGLRRIPVVGRPLSGLLQHVLPTSRHPSRQVRVLDTFDWYSPKFQSKHTYEEVFRWFESCGLESLKVLGLPVSVRGRKPLAPIGPFEREEGFVGKAESSEAEPVEAT